MAPAFTGPMPFLSCKQQCQSTETNPKHSQPNQRKSPTNLIKVVIQHPPTEWTLLPLRWFSDASIQRTVNMQ